MLFTHASSCFFHALPFHALPLTPSRPHRLHAMLTLTPPNLRLRPFWRLKWLDDCFSFLLLSDSLFPCLSTYLAISFLLSNYPLAPCYPIQISRCSYIADFFFGSYISKFFLLVYSQSWSFSDACLLPHLTPLFDIHVRTWFVGWQFWLYTFRLDDSYSTWCSLTKYDVWLWLLWFLCEEDKAYYGQSALGATTKRSLRLGGPNSYTLLVGIRWIQCGKFYLSRDVEWYSEALSLRIGR